MQICQVKGASGGNLSDNGISLSSFSAEELPEAQKQDENLDYLREFLVSGAVSTAEDLYGCNPQVKCYNLKLDCLRVDDSGVIWRQTDARNAERILAPSHTAG